MNSLFISNNKQGKITAFDLKLIAVFFMFIDHSAVALLQDISRALGYTCNYKSDETLSLIYTYMRYAGRFAFPIFCFFIVEGFWHTRSKLHYAKRLLIFAILSEIPFDYALFDGNFFDFYHNNVYWTLLVALVGIWGMDEIKNSTRGVLANLYFKNIGMILVAGIAMGVAELANTDYGLAGVGAIIIMYLLYDKGNVFAVGAGTIFLGLTSSLSELYALLMLIPLYFYNGKQGRYNKVIKWGFYMFYPCHLLLLGLIRYLVLK